MQKLILLFTTPSCSFSPGRPTLESALRSHHTALYLGEKLSTPFGPHTYVFRVLELKPASAVSIVDTDLEVDLVEMMSQSLPRLGSSIKGKLCPVTWGSPLYVPWTGLTGEVGEDEDLEHGYGGNRVVRYFRIPLASIGNDRQIRVSVQSAGLNIGELLRGAWMILVNGGKVMVYMVTCSYTPLSLSSSLPTPSYTFH